MEYVRHRAAFTLHRPMQLIALAFMSTVMVASSVSGADAQMPDWRVLRPGQTALLPDGTIACPSLPRLFERFRDLNATGCKRTTGLSTVVVTSVTPWQMIAGFQTHAAGVRTKDGHDVMYVPGDILEPIPPKGSPLCVLTFDATRRELAAQKVKMVEMAPLGADRLSAAIVTPLHSTHTLRVPTRWAFYDGYPLRDFLPLQMPIYQGAREPVLSGFDLYYCKGKGHVPDYFHY